MKTWLTTIAVSVLLSATACNKNNKAEQLAALENAYQSGILSKAEYEGKKTALTGSLPPAAGFLSEPSAPAPRVAAVPPSPAPAKPTPFPEPPSSPKNPSVSTPPDGFTQPSSSGNGNETAPRLAGCEETEFKSGKEKGKQERFFSMPAARVRQAALLALKNLDFKITRNAGREIEASKKRHLGILIGAGGEKVVLRFEEAQQRGQKGTRVTGETKKNSVLRAGQKSWTNAVLAQTACLLDKGASPP
jgi:hypothetical protein